jgi:hypothetical protein
MAIDPASIMGVVIVREPACTSRACWAEPSFWTCSTNGVPEGTAMVAGLIENSLSVTATGSVAAVVVVAPGSPVDAAAVPVLAGEMPSKATATTTATDIRTTSPRNNVSRSGLGFVLTFVLLPRFGG